MENRPVQRANSHLTQAPRITVTLNSSVPSEIRTKEETTQPAVFAKSLLDSSFAFIETKPGY
jgi:hypothetical protein